MLSLVLVTCPLTTKSTLYMPVARDWALKRPEASTGKVRRAPVSLFTMTTEAPAAAAPYKVPVVLDWANAVVLMPADSDTAPNATASARATTVLLSTSALLCLLFSMGLPSIFVESRATKNLHQDWRQVETRSRPVSVSVERL